MCVFLPANTSEALENSLLLVFFFYTFESFSRGTPWDKTVRSSRPSLLVVPCRLLERLYIYKANPTAQVSLWKWASTTTVSVWRALCPDLPALPASDPERSRSRVHICSHTEWRTFRGIHNENQPSPAQLRTVLDMSYRDEVSSGSGKKDPKNQSKPREIMAHALCLE